VSVTKLDRLGRLIREFARPLIDRKSRANAISGPASSFRFNVRAAGHVRFDVDFLESIYGSAPFGSPSVANPHVLPAMFWVARLTPYQRYLGGIVA
jgi:hypothetical protein